MFFDIFFFNFGQTMTDEKTTSEESFHSPQRKITEIEEEVVVLKVAEDHISSPEPRDERDVGHHDSGPCHSPTRRNRDNHRQSKPRPRFRGSTYRPNYEEPAERPRSLHSGRDTEERFWRWEREMTRREDEHVRRDEYIRNDERKYSHETQYDERGRKYDSWYPRR
jgi:hypothetical protein